MAHLIECLDYKSKKEEKPVIGYKINLTKTGIDQTGITKDDKLDIKYQQNKIIIEKIK